MRVMVIGVDFEADVSFGLIQLATIGHISASQRNNIRHVVLLSRLGTDINANDLESIFFCLWC